VIDTNVFCHSHNPKDQHFQASLDFLKMFLVSETQLCVDDGGDFLVESRNRSAIVSEYRTHIPPTSSAFQILVRLFSTGRVKQISKALPSKLGRLVPRLVTDKTDRVFLKVAINSQEQTLTSHDFAGFSRRGDIFDQTGVYVCTAGECKPLL
jgi:hypothetical protein